MEGGGAGTGAGESAPLQPQPVESPLRAALLDARRNCTAFALRSMIPVLPMSVCEQVARECPDDQSAIWALAEQHAREERRAEPAVDPARLVADNQWHLLKRLVLNVVLAVVVSILYAVVHEASGSFFGGAAIVVLALCVADGLYIYWPEVPHPRAWRC